MFPPVVVLLYAPVVVWVATGLGLLLSFRRSAPPVVLRLAAAFMALWALLATTTLVWVLDNGGWAAIVELVRSPLLLFSPRYSAAWLLGAVGAVLVFGVAFVVNQLVGRGFLRLLRTSTVPWPVGLSRPSVRTSLLSFRSERAEAFSFTLLELGRGGPARWHRHEVILLSRALWSRLEPDEREAVVAHELGHLRGLDGRYLTFLRTLSRMMRWDPLLAYLTARLTSREEYRADYEAAMMTRRPLSLARALYKVCTPSGPPSTTHAAFLGGGGSRGRREAMERIRRLVALSESSEFGGSVE
ncbi:MAG: M48 family metalloprotease [Thermoplasmata archaeon]|nr:M48 family metalloprotease [Thermoplasmata archaeon]